METYFWVNYLFKYVELVDTVCIVLKKKPLSNIIPFLIPSAAYICLASFSSHLPSYNYDHHIISHAARQNRLGKLTLAIILDNKWS